MERIRRNAWYYTDSSKQNHWCAACYEKLQDFEPIFLDDGIEIKKNDLLRQKNDAIAEEAWIECYLCKTWIHQICGLYNGRSNITVANFVCPKCVLKSRAETGNLLPDGTSIQTAKDLPQCAMSQAIEVGVQCALQKSYEKRATELNCPVDNVQKVNNIYVRVVNNSERRHAVREEVSHFPRSHQPFMIKGCYQLTIIFLIFACTATDVQSLQDKWLPCRISGQNEVYSSFPDHSWRRCLDFRHVCI